MSDFETVILSACRTPIGAFGGVFKVVSAVDLGAVVIREAIVELNEAFAAQALAVGRELGLDGGRGSLKVRSLKSEVCRR